MKVKSCVVCAVQGISLFLYGKTLKKLDLEKWRNFLRALLSPLEEIVRIFRKDAYSEHRLDSQ